MTKSFQSIKKYRPFLSYLAKNFETKILIAIVFVTQIYPIFAQDFSYELVAAGTQSPDVIFDVELTASGTEEVYKSEEIGRDIPHFKIRSQWSKECASRSTQVCLPDYCELDVSRTHTDSNKLSGNYGGPGYGIFVSNPYFHSGSGASHRLSYQNGSWCLNSNIKICSKRHFGGSAHYSGRNVIYGKCTHSDEPWTQTQQKGPFTINEKTGYSQLAEYNGQIGSLVPNTLKEEFTGTEEYSVEVPYFQVKGKFFSQVCQNKHTTVCLPNYCELDVSRSHTTSNKIANNVGRSGYGIFVSRQQILGGSTATHKLYQDASREGSRSWCLASNINLCARVGTSFYEGKNVIYGKCTSLGQKRGPIGEKKIYSVEVLSQKDSSVSDILGDILQLEMFDSKSSISGINGKFFWAKTTYRTPWSSSKQGIALIPTISGITNVDFISDIAPNNDTIYTASITVPPSTGITYVDNDGDGVIDAGDFVGWLNPAHEFLVALDGPPLAVIDEISPNPAAIGEEVSFSGHGEHYEPIINAVWQTNRLLNSGSKVLHTCLETPCNFSKNNLPNGQHLISFSVETAKTASPEATKVLKINQAPKASIVFVKSTGEANGIVKAVKWSDNEPHDPIHFVGQAVDLDGVITKYEWELTRVEEDGKLGKKEIIGNTPSFTYTNLSLGTYQIKLHVEDNNGITADSSSRTVEVLKPPVLLVHGFISSAGKAWGWLDGNTVNGYKFHAVDVSPNNERFSYGAKIISEEIQQLVEDYGVPKVNIIAHSMGGLNSRWYIQNPGYRNDVNKLVMLGTPNHGSTLAAVLEPSKSGKHKFPWYFTKDILALINLIIDKWFSGPKTSLPSGPAILDLIPQSSALRALNYNKKDEGFGKNQPKDNTKTVYNSQVPYFNIYGKNLPSLSHKHIIIDLLFDEWEIVLPTLSFNTDLVVDGKSAQLDGILSKSFPWVCHDRDIFFGEDRICPEGLTRFDKVFQQALQYLGSNPSLQTSLSVEDSITDTTQALTEQILFVTEEPPVISMGETKQHQFNVDPEIVSLHVVLMSSFVEGSHPNLSFSLVSPIGVLFDENTISPDVTYEISPNSISYSINNVEKGDWTAIVKSTSNEPTQYMLIASGETDFWVGMVEGGQVKPMEPFTITAYAQKAGTPLTGLEVKTALFKTLDEGERINSKYGTDLRNVEPIEIALTDLGDGRYETTYHDTLIPGVYFVLVTATDPATGLSRETFTNFFVEYQFELSVQGSDISFSNNNPEHNENITISAEIHNNSDLKAKAVEVWFADGRLDDGGTVFAKETIDNIAANGKAVISTSWTAKAGAHEIVVIVSPLNTFVENNVTNNIASKTIIVADQPPIAVAGTDQTVRFDSDTQTNVHIFLDGGNSTDDTGIEQYEWDINTQLDSNGDGIADNDIDLVGIQPFISAGTYTEVGEYEVKLTVFDKAGQSNADTLTIHLVEAYDFEPPIAEAGADQIARIGEPIYFDGSGSYDNYGIATYSWDIDVNTDSNGDGIADNDIDLTGVRPTLSWGYSIEGIYTAKLTVTDVAGNEPASDTLTVYVGDQFYRIQGYVKDKSGIPIDNAKIIVNGQTVITQETGYWEIIGITPGKYTLIASKTGYNFIPKNFVVAGNEHTINLNIDVVNSALCQLYAVNDGALNRSQFFTITLNDYQVSKLGPLHIGYDIEALATHPQTNIIYAASGDNTTTTESRGYLYIVDGQTGELFPIGSTGFNEIEALTFDSSGTLWAWAKGDGLVVIDPNTGNGDLFIPSDVSIEDFTSSKTDNTLFYGAAKTDLWIYDIDTNRLEVVCTNLLGETEALEMMPDGSLLFGTHQDKTLSLHAFDPNTCNVISGIEIPTYKFNDVEGITLPIEACLK